MTLLNVKMDSIDFKKKMKNLIDYSGGFLDGIDLERINFNRFLGGYSVEALGKYIDSMSRMHPDELHHVYEPGCVGMENSRLFRFNVNANKYTINIKGEFLKSKGIPLNGGTPLQDRANIMENSIEVTIVPRASSVLAFEDNGETVFSSKAIVIDHPGGDAVAGSFGKTVESFFDSYFRTTMLAPIMKDLSKANEFTSNFSAGISSGKYVGVRAGREYFSTHGVGIE